MAEKGTIYHKFGLNDICLICGVHRKRTTANWLICDYSKDGINFAKDFINCIPKPKNIPTKRADGKDPSKFHKWNIITPNKANCIKCQCIRISTASTHIYIEINGKEHFDYFPCEGQLEIL